MLAPEKFLSLIMMGLVGFVALCVATFSARYLKGDRKQAAFYLNLTGMVAAVFIMVSADHLLLFLVAWGASNLFLVRLMLHKSCWGAAKASAHLALKNFSLGFFFLGAALLIFYWATGESSLRTLLKSPIETPWLIAGTLFILLAAMTQSSLWPFHSWLISSLNSPTPVSAIMHAGLINGGGILLARFAPLLFQT
ncbi:MAG: proton-conducting membrane transporter, partial [Chlamydiia bacterium]|nr:proton-conducting membrane transporter [Chlamydiia bacterium]